MKNIPQLTEQKNLFTYTKNCDKNKFKNNIVLYNNNRKSTF